MVDESQKRRVAHYTNRRDAELAHPALDLSAPMRKSDFADITDSYSYPEVDWVKCQLEIDGSTCHQDHGIGWFMIRKDGVEGYIGGDCAQVHFKTDKVFAGAVAKARRDIRTQNLVDRLGNLIQDREVLRQRIVDGFERQQKLRKRVGNIRDLLPYAVMDRLHHMTKTGDRNLRVEFGYQEKDEDRDQKVIEVTRWRAEVVGTLAAPQALEVAAIEEIGERLRSALAACGQAEASPERSERELRGWAESIESVDRSQVDLDEAVSALAAFVELTNLRGLCWVCRKDEDQVKAARAVLRMTGSRDVSDSTARRARDTWRDEIAASRKGAKFRVP
jgi:hypothetical protein